MTSFIDLTDDLQRHIFRKLPYQDAFSLCLTNKRAYETLYPSIGDCHGNRVHETPCFYRVSWSRSGKWLATVGKDGYVKIIDVVTGQTRTCSVKDTWDTNIVFSPDDRMIACICRTKDHFVTVWNIEEDTLVATLKGHTDWITSVAFSPDGRTLATGSQDRTVRLWNLEGTTVHVLNACGFLFLTIRIAFSPDGTCLLSSALDNVVRLWNVATGIEIGAWLLADDVTSFAFSPDGRLLAMGTFNDVHIMRVDTGDNVAKLTGSSNKYINYLTFNESSDRILTVTTETDAVRIWNIETRACERVVSIGASKSIAFCPTAVETRVAALSWDGVLRLRDLRQE